MHLSDLWRERNFLNLWLSQTISLIGSQISFLALPLTAVVLLDATPLQMGLLTAAGSLPALAISLFAGVWVDRHRRKPILVAVDVARAVLAAAVPILVLLDALQMDHLYVIAFFMSGLGIFFDLAYRALLPSLLARKRLVEGNSKLELGRSLAELVGPGIGGVLIEWLTAPIALLVDACSYLLSALFLALVHVKENIPSARKQTLWHDIGEGVRFVTGNPLLRVLAGCNGLLNLFNSMLEAIFVLYLTEVVGLSPWLIGVAFSVGSIGFLVGTLLPDRLVRRFGLGPALISGLFIAASSDLLLPFMRGSTTVTAVMLVIAQFFFGLGIVVFNTGQVSVRQAVTPLPLQGRMHATLQLLTEVAVPLGALLGGLLGVAIGMRLALLLAAFGELTAVVWLLLSPVRTLQEEPAAVAG